MNEIITVIPTGLNCHSHKKYINICKFTQKCNKNRDKLGVLKTLSLKTLISWEKKTHSVHSRKLYCIFPLKYMS